MATIAVPSAWKMFSDPEGKVAARASLLRNIFPKTDEATTVTPPAFMFSDLERL